jgi:putative hydrolase of the HAD superfamily
MADKHIVLFIDSGDTLVDEGTEVKDAGGVVLRTELIEGAADTLRALHDAGYTIALVADGLKQSFDNIYKQHKLEYCFDARAISEIAGCSKPAGEMFQTAMDQLHLSDIDKNRIVMVGNNLKRDIVGANRFGIASVFLDWSPRYPHEPSDSEETPDYVIHLPAELPALLQRLEESFRACGSCRGR